MRNARGVLGAVLLMSLAGCGTLPSSNVPKRGAGGSEASGRCQTTGTAQNPIVTEWSASEKAHLQSLAANGPVAVRFAGCELSIVESCALPGRYAWQRTTLATDTLEIEDKNELYSKLPIGAVQLEATLEEAGKLSVQSTVAGQLMLLGTDLKSIALGPACGEATHVVSRVSVGAFKMYSGRDSSGKGGISATVVGASGGTSRSQALLREAGDAKACTQATAEAPADQCAAPIQLFLSPLRPEQEAWVVAAGAVQVSLPRPDHWDETWSLRDSRGTMICRLPCTQWINPSSGYYLLREPGPDIDLAKIAVPSTFPHAPGSRLRASYQMEKGSPFWSTMTVYAIGIPATLFGGYALTKGVITSSAAPCAPGDPECDDRPPATYFSWSALAFGLAGATLWWNLYSQEERFETQGLEGTSGAGFRHDVGVATYRVTF